MRLQLYNTTTGEDIFNSIGEFLKKYNLSLDLYSIDFVLYPAVCNIRAFNSKIILVAIVLSTGNTHTEIPK